MPSSVRHLLVDARPLDHPTAGQRGIGRWVRGFLQGLAAIEAPFTALYRTDEQAEILAREIPSAPVLHWDRVEGEPDLRAPDVWYLAPQFMLHPISLDPIPSIITELRLPVAALTHDVIPFRYPEIYFKDTSARLLAEIRSSLVRTVDVMLSVSEFSAVTSAEHLRFPFERVAVIGAGSTDAFVPVSQRHVPMPERFAPLSEVSFVVAVTGADERKNTEGLIRAWSLIDISLRRHRRLVIATGVPAAVEQRWRTVAHEAGVDAEVFITGSLSDDEMVALLQHAELSVMPSLEEGFGLPVVEAAACGCPVICSDRSSLPEVLDEPAATFDPTDPAAMAAAIDRALRDEDHRRVLGDAADRAVRRWTWANAARRTMTALEELGPRWSMSRRTVED